MTVNVEKMRTDIDKGRIDIEKMRADMKWEARKFLISAILATTAAVGAGVGIGNLIWAHAPASASRESSR